MKLTIVHHDAKILQQKIDVGIEATFTTFPKQYQQTSTTLKEALQIFELYIYNISTSYGISY